MTLVEQQVEELRRTIVEEVLSWVGTPYRQNCMQKGRGADCARVGIRGFQVAGLIPWEVNPPLENRDRLLAGDRVDKDEFRRFILSVGGIPIQYEDRLPADIVTFAFLDTESHIGTLVERDWMVDAISGGRVRRRRLLSIPSLVGLYRHRALFAENRP